MLVCIEAPTVCLLRRQGGAVQVEAELFNAMLEKGPELCIAALVTLLKSAPFCTTCNFGDLLLFWQCNTIKLSYFVLKASWEARSVQFD